MEGDPAHGAIDCVVIGLFAQECGGMIRVQNRELMTSEPFFWSVVPPQKSRGYHLCVQNVPS